MDLGTDDGTLMFQVYDEVGIDQEYYNDSIIHATCSLDVFEYGTGTGYWGGLNGSVLTTEPYDNIEHGIRYSTTLGLVSFILDMNQRFWEENATYAWQLHCYCLNSSNLGLQTQHQCWYEFTETQTPFLSCTSYGNFTTGMDNRTPDTNGSYYGIALILLGSIAILAYFSRRTEDDIIKGLLSMTTMFLLVVLVNISRLIAIHTGTSQSVVTAIWTIVLTFMLISMFMIFYIGYKLVVLILTKLSKAKI